MKVTILNTSILTTYGSYTYEQVSLKEAKNLIKNGFKSAVGHQSTCDVLSTLLEVEVPLNRVMYEHKKGEIALIFKLRQRPEEGKILTAEEIEKIGYDFGVIKKIK